MRRSIASGLGLTFGMLLAANSAAHEGEVHRDEAASTAPLSAAALAERPRRLPDGELYLPKAAQHLLGIRTQPWFVAATVPLSLVAEVQAQPAAAVTITAPEPGRLEPAGEGGRSWPLPGRTVHAGDVLAWLSPQITQRDAARRRAQVAAIDQQLVIANLNVDRLGLQGAVNADQKVATGNIYLEQAVAERDALVHQRELVTQSLHDRVPLRALVSGHVQAAPARAGDVVAAGQVLFQLADGSRSRLVAISFDPELGERVRGAKLRLDPATEAALVYRGEEPLAGAPGWRLLFDLAQGAALSPGQLVEVRVEAAADEIAGLPVGACALEADGSAVAWVHRAPERFAPLRLKSCTAGVRLAQGDRLVTQGAGLLSQYR
ncbi:MAG: HlyD family secretion protein [Nevskia sp.]|nr:HlyD family secretion protein [Nevskia sp.]